MHGSIGVLQIDSTDGLVGFNDALEELVAPWPSVNAWWDEVRLQADELQPGECPECGEPELNGTVEVNPETPGGDRIEFRISFHGHTHADRDQTGENLRGVRSVGIVERGAMELADGDGDGLTHLSEASAPEQFERLGLKTDSASEGLSEDSSPGEIALAYVRRALSWPLRSALRQLEPLVGDLGAVESGAEVDGESNGQVLNIYRATESLLELVQTVDKSEPDHRQRQFLDALRSLATGMNQSLDVDQVADQVFRCFDDLLGFERAAIVVRRDEDVQVLADRGGGERLKDDIAPTSWLRGVNQAKPELVVTDPAFRDESADDLDAAAEVLLGEDERPKTTADSVDVWLLLPLVGRDGETFGCFGMQREHPSDSRLTIESYDRQLLGALADQAALAILNAWKYAEARKEANTDPVTELYGRRYMERQTREAMLHSAQTNDDLALLMVDIDHFKDVNDKYGHVVGDAILEQVASRCRDVLREGDLVGRYGGEEFICLLPGADLKAAREAGERLRKAVREQPFAVNGHRVTIRVTVGVARFTDDIDDFDEFVERADSALYAAKRAGRDRVATYEALSKPDRKPRVRR